MKKYSILAFSIIALAALVVWAPNASAFESYHDPGLNDDGYCASVLCHPGFGGGRNDVTHTLHTGGANPVTGNCDLCHTGSGRDNPLTLWSTYNSGMGYGCTGCHGRDYGETIEADYRGFPITGLPKASGWGLRRVHELAGVTECITCHGDMIPLTEDVPPPYYSDPASGSNVTDPCADNLDNDGDGMLDGMDTDCIGNEPPVAVDDAYTTDEDTILTVAAPGVLGNDSDPDNDPITAVLDTSTSNGNLSLNADGSFTYTPNANYFGPDSFTYFANDSQVNSDLPATVTITVNDINDPPIADANGPYTGTAGVPVSFDGSASSDIDGTIASYMWDFGDGNTGMGVTPTHTYAMAGTYTVMLTVTDDDGATDTDTATATIGDANLPPVAVDDTYTTDEDVTLNVPAPGVLGNDSDPDNDPITAVLGTPTSNGSLMLNADGSFMYTPNLNFFGTDSFTYFANDGQVNSLTPATVTITVNDINDPPIADANGPYTGTAGVPVSFDGSASSDIDGTIASYMWNFGDGNTGMGVTPTHTYAMAGTYTVMLTVTDDDGATGMDTTTATIGDANLPPVAVDDTYTTDEDVTLNVPAPGVLGNDSDPDNDPITAVLNTPTSNGSLMLNADGSFMYTPNLNFFGTDSFTYFANDGQVNSLTPATVTITVNDINDPPIADANGPYTGTAGIPVSFDGSASSDIDGTIASYMWDFGDGNTGMGVTPMHTYVMAGNYTVMLTVTDDDGATGMDTTTATIGDANLPPVAVDDTYTTDEDVTLNVPAPGVLGNDSDPDNDPITAVLDTPTSNGSLMLNADGSFMYTPNLNFFGTDSFTYFANDGQVNSLTPATVTITVNDINDSPIADANGPYTGTAGVPVQFDGSGSSDVDGTIVSYMWDFGDGGTGTAITPIHTYAAAGTYTVMLTVTDDDGATGMDTTTATIQDAQVGDVWLDSMRVPKKKRLSTRKIEVTLELIAKGDSDTEQMATVCIVADTPQGGVLVNFTGTGPDPNCDMQLVVPGNGNSTFTVPAKMQCQALDDMTYPVNWTATISAPENSDTSNDTMMKTTDVICVDGAAEAEICNDGEDNDGDGKIDCADKKDCKNDPFCQ